MFRAAARDAALPPAIGVHGYDDIAIEQLLTRFVRNGRLAALPAKDARRRTVLEHVARDFEPGVRYSERDVDDVLRSWTEGGATDHVTVRRYLVDHDLLSRGGGEYWRSGGRLDPSGRRTLRANL